MIKLKDGTKKYGRRTIIDKPNYYIPEKTICTIIGLSGSGKSNLLNMDRFA